MKKNYCLLMAMLFMSLTNVFGQVDTWTGNISNSLTKKGTTYLIQSAADLAFLAQEVNKGNAEYVSASYKLTTDIDLNNKSWTPIGNTNDATKNFKGVFDGQGHLIRKLTIQANVSTGTGLFGSATAPTIIKNLKLDQATISNTAQVTAVLVGSLTGTVENCSVTNSTVTGNTGKCALLVGKTWNASIKNCFVYNGKTICGSGGQGAVGSLIGELGGGAAPTKLIQNCFVINSTISEGAKTDAHGYILGSLAGVWNAKLSYCYATGDKPLHGTSAVVGAPAGNKTFLVENSSIESLSFFANPELAWNFNTNGTTTNTAIWSHNGGYPIFADANNMAVYKAGTIYTNSMTGTQCYTSGVLPENFTAIDLRTNAETIPDENLVTLLDKGSKNLLVYSNSAITDYTGNVITGDNPQITLTDGAPFHCPIEINNADITYTRNFAEGWNTVCLPFAFATTADDADKVEKLVSGTAESVRFEYVTNGTEANTPYLINIKSAGEKTFSATGVSIPTSASLNNTVAGGYTFQGTMMASTLTEGYGLVLDKETQEVMFKKIPVAGYPITPFRAYLTGTATPSNAPLRVIHGDGGATNLGNDTAEETFRIFAGEGCVYITSGKARNVKMFSIDGRLSKSIQLNEGTNTISGVHQGIYLINNQKVVVK